MRDLFFLIIASLMSCAATLTFEETSALFLPASDITNLETLSLTETPPVSRPEEKLQPVYLGVQGFPPF